MKVILLLLILLIIGNVYAQCNENQIDINSASAEELDELYGIGEVKAQAIIDTRPFNSVDDLINVNGIGNVTLSKIKEQGLACVNEKDDEEEDEEIEETETEDTQEQNEQNFQENSETEINKNKEPLTFSTINLNSHENLNPKDIKSEDDKESSNKNNYAKYGLIIFCVLLVCLFILRRKKYKNETEFE